MAFPEAFKKKAKGGPVPAAFASKKALGGRKKGKKKSGGMKDRLAAMKGAGNFGKSHGGY
jgi:hypothetical protein